MVIDSGSKGKGMRENDVRNGPEERQLREK